MASQTVSTNMTLEAVIALGLLSGENITINGGAVITCTETPSILLGRITVNDGELHIDGTVITSGNILNFLGEGGNGSIDETITVNGQGTLRITGGWYSIGTTDGTNSQVIDLSTATGSAYWDKGSADFCPSTIPMIQIETGRRINYTAGTGLAPIVGDMMTLVSDREIMGRIVSVDATYFVVSVLTGAFVGGEAIQIRRVVDNFGADLQVAWTGTVNGADVKEAGVYHLFGNSRSDETSYIATFGNGYGGLVFDNEFASTILTLGSTAGGGFVPPPGCDIRTPNINMNSSRLAEYDLGQALMPAANNLETDWYGLECSAGGTIILDTMCAGNFMLSDNSAFRYDASYVGAVSNVGSPAAANRTTFDHCVVVQDPVAVSEAASKSLGNVTDLVNGAEITNCMIINSRILGMNIGGTTSLDVVVSDCIVTAAGNTPTLDTNAVYNFYFNTIKKSRMTRCMSFGNNHTSQFQALFYSRGGDHECDSFMYSDTQDYSFGTSEIDTIASTNSDGLTISGVEVIGNGVGGNNMISMTDTLNVKIRAIGMIDDKIDFGSDGEYLVSLVGLCDNTSIARCWKTGGIFEEAVFIPTTAKGTTVVNCSGKYASELQPSGVNTRFIGVHGGSGTFGGSVGWEDAYLSSFGNSFHHGFQSDTKGTLACLMINPSTSADETNVIAGNPRFFKDGDLDGTNGDIIEFTPSAEYYMIGITGFTGNFTGAVGAAGYFADELTNTDLFFQYEINGGGWNGAWLDIRTPANLTGIAIATTDKVRIKMRFEFTGNQNSMSAVTLETNTSLQSQKDTFHPIDQVENTVTLTGIIAGSEVRIYDNEDGDTTTSLGTELAGTESSLTTFAYTYQTTGNEIIIQVMRNGYEEYLQASTLPTVDSNLVISQKVDTNA